MKSIKKRKLKLSVVDEETWLKIKLVGGASAGWRALPTGCNFSWFATQPALENMHPEMPYIISDLVRRKINCHNIK